ncbi:MAG: hypothetical protein AAF772_03440 [Acidobacteriota bacterium]
MPATARDARHPARVVLLGASNLAMSLPHALAALAARVEMSPAAETAEPVHVLCANGHGRSYGLGSTVLVRWLPGIVGCGLWDALERDASTRPGATEAVLLDVGNDVPYGVPVATVLDWARTCLTRLAAVDARVTVVGLPIARVERLHPVALRVVHRALFPFSRVPPAELLPRARAIDAGLRDLAETFGARHRSLPLDWYGLDPIHVRPSARADAWRDWLDASHSAPPPSSALRRFCRRAAVRGPARRRVFGIVQRGQQPVGRWRDLSLSLY